MRVIIADDMRPALNFAKRALRDAGHEIVGLAVNGREAIALCEKLRPDVVILDISMPVMTGDVAAKAILEAGTAKHVVVASSVSMGGMFDHLRALGCKTVGKPYDQKKLPKELAAIVAASEDQSWFWTEEWQAKEREADADIAAGRVTRYDPGEEFLASLNSGE